MALGSKLPVIIAVLGLLYQFVGHHLFVVGGLFRSASSYNNEGCTTVPALEACEKLVVHPPSGLVYLACSTPESRRGWLPYFLHFNSTAAGKDSIVLFNPSEKGIAAVTKIRLDGLTDSRGFSSHGMDVVESSQDPSILFLYVINHRPPLSGSAARIGADSAVEIFKTKVGSNTATHIKTIQDPLVTTPNDIVGSDKGDSFFVTNDHMHRVGLSRVAQLILNLPITSVVHCTIDKGCKFALSGIRSANGIIRSGDKFFVTNNMGGQIDVYNRTINDLLIYVESIHVGRPLDNLSIDTEGSIWASNFINSLRFLAIVKGQAPNTNSPVSVTKIARDYSVMEQGKYKVERVFEDDGAIASGATTAAVDLQRRKLFITGIMAPWLTVCPLK